MTKRMICVVLVTASFAGFAQSGKDWMKFGRLDEQLDLTEEQKPKVEAILKEQREKIRAVRKETRKRLKEVLTPEQIEKFERLGEEKRERWRQYLR